MTFPECSSVAALPVPMMEGLRHGSQLTGRVKKNVDPSTGLESAQMRPPERSTMRRQIVSPIPDPGCSSRCKRVNGSKIVSEYSAGNPTPLSRTAIVAQRSSTVAGKMCTCAFVSGILYLIALLMRLRNKRVTCLCSTITVGNGSCVTIAPASAMAAPNCDTAASTSSSKEMDTAGCLSTHLPSRMRAGL